MPKLNKAVSTSFLRVAESLLGKSVGLISTLILARVLTPDDFGLVAMAAIFTGFVDTLHALTDGGYIVRSKRINSAMINTNWSISLVARSLIALITTVGAPFVANYFGNPEVEYILYVTAASTMVGGFFNPAKFLLIRQQNVSKLVLIKLLSKVLAVIIAILIAVIYESFWALILGAAAANLFSTIGSYFIHWYRPSISFKNMKDQLSFSIWLLAQSILGYSRTQVDSFLMASSFSANQLGQYNTMKYFSLLPSMVLIGPATGPLLRQLSVHQDNKEYFARCFNVATIVALTLALFIMGVFISASEDIIYILLGDQWTEYSFLFALLSLSMPSLVLYHQTNRFFVIRKNTRAIFLLEVFTLIAMAVALWIVGLEDIKLFAITKVSVDVCATVIVFLGVTIYSFKGLGLNLYVLLFMQGIAFSSAMFAVSVIPHIENPYFNVLVCSLFFGAVFFALFAIGIGMTRNKVKESSMIITYIQKLLKWFN